MPLKNDFDGKYKDYYFTIIAKTGPKSIHKTEASFTLRILNPCDGVADVAGEV